MDKRSEGIRSPAELERPQPRGLPVPSTTVVQRPDAPVPALTLTLAGSAPFFMDRVGQFFSGTVAPQGNALVSELVDENGPLAGRESARGKRKSSALPMQFGDDDRPVLFAPNDAPDELSQGQSELDRLLRRQECRERRGFTA
jgi:hypothetical protein